MIYLNSVELPSKADENFIFMSSVIPVYYHSLYPFKFFTSKDFQRIEFDHITIFAGSNGSGKSTLLNIFANLLKLSRTSEYNDSAYMSMYVRNCQANFDLKHNFSQSKIITSDDVFKSMLQERRTQNMIHRKQDNYFEDGINKRYSEPPRHIDCSDPESIEQYIEHVDCKHKGGIWKHVMAHAGKDRILHSNGENAIDFFVNAIEPNGLYLLDEPENSLSPEKQILLKTFLESMTRFENCQFIIATHSPFLMSLNYSKLYDLDENPVKTKKWYELEQVRHYYQFFMDNKQYFV